MKKILLLVVAVGLIMSCKKTSKEQNKPEEVTIYTHRHYPPDQELFAQFEKETGIKVNVVNASADELIQKMQLEGPASPADVLITVDAGRLVRAKEKGLLQATQSAFLDSIIPPHLRDAEKQWFALTKRARVIAYAKDRINPEQLSTYEDLASDTWSKKLLIRSSSNIYNQSLMASLIANLGEEKAKNWAQAIVNNMARTPKGNDRDQVKAVVAGEGDLAIVNTYYVGRMINTDDPVESNAGKGVGIFFPNQNDRGTHINISGAGVAKYSPNKTNAIKFIEFLASGEAQSVFAEANFEYPVNQNVAPAPLLQEWGNFKEDELNLSALGTNNKKAVLLFDEVGWQ
ncbi:MAG: Fe(3+) ABC transporter substrate-binding protein [Croceivirga sp.]